MICLSFNNMPEQRFEKKETNQKQTECEEEHVKEL